MQHLLDWIVDENRTYSDGLELFKQLSPNRNLVRFYSVGENITTKQGLYEQLKAIAKQRGLTIPFKDVVVVYRKGEQKPNFEQPQDTPQGTAKQEYLPASVEELPEQAELTKRHAYLFRQKEILRLSLHNFPKNNQAEIVSQRRLVMQEILALKKEIGEIVEKKKFFNKFGYYPSEYKETKDDIIRKLDNARSNVSRQKKIIATAKTIEQKEKAEAALKKYEKIRNEMSKKLEAI